AEAMAKGRMRKIAEGHVVATLETIGNPGMIPGATVKLEKMGAQIDGSYRVEKALHQFSKHGYYVNLKAVRVAKASPPAAKAAAPAPSPAPAPAPAPGPAGGGAQTATAQTAAGTGAGPAQAATAGTGPTQAQAAQTTPTQAAPAAAGTPQASLSSDAKSPQAPDAA